MSNTFKSYKPLSLRAVSFFSAFSFINVCDSATWRLKKILRRWEEHKNRQHPETLNNYDLPNSPEGTSILGEILNRIAIDKAYFIEISESLHCDPNVSGETWRGVFIHDQPTLTDKQKEVYTGDRVHCLTAEPGYRNLDELLQAVGAPSEPDVLNIHIRGNDYWVWKTLTKYQPRIIRILYNAGYLPWRKWEMPFQPDYLWDGSRCFGASLRSLCNLGKTKGYSLVACDTIGTHAYFVRNDQLGNYFLKPGALWHHYRHCKIYWNYFGFPKSTSKDLHAGHYRRITGHLPRFRPGTMDQMIWNTVPRDYSVLPSRLRKQDTILDLGLHIGSFSALAALRGAGKIISAEANEGNFRLAQENLAPFPQCEPHHAAVWESGEASHKDLSYSTCPVYSNTGGGGVMFQPPGLSSTAQSKTGPGNFPSHHQVKTISLDDLIPADTKVRFLKIDVEGAEYPILMTATRLAQVDCILGEYHELSIGTLSRSNLLSKLSADLHAMPALAAFLNKQGFWVCWRCSSSDSGFFFASRTTHTLTRLCLMHRFGRIDYYIPLPAGGAPEKVL